MKLQRISHIGIKKAFTLPNANRRDYTCQGPRLQLPELTLEEERLPPMAKACKTVKSNVSGDASVRKSRKKERKLLKNLAITYERNVETEIQKPIFCRHQKNLNYFTVIIIIIIILVFQLNTSHLPTEIIF